MQQSDIWPLMDHFPLQGELVWIGLRPARKQPMETVTKVWVDSDFGLQGDHYAGRTHKRQITLLQWEHLAVLESLLGKPVRAERLRRNLLIKGLNLIALKQHRFSIGSAMLKMTGLCHPCSRMETELGEGGYNAMRNHGGITAQVLQSGWIKTGDHVSVLPPDND